MNQVILQNNELQEGKLHRTSFAIAKHSFEVHGYLKIENLFRKPFIQELGQAVLSHFQVNKEGMTLSNGAQVAHGRYIVNIPFTAPFNDRELYANPILLSLMNEFLGPHFILSSLGCVVSLPGATDQHVHADYFPLFEENPAFVGMHPPFAITIAVPLIDIDPVNGPTKVWSGSHRTYPIDKNMRAYPMHLLHGPVGSCYFWDYRTFHAGGSNHSDELRPLLYFSYTRRWFRDSLNPDLLQLKKEEFEKVPEEHRKLFPFL
jgi:ectoine hydroxylase-related dioxygenase (phytanoyl-CoA dioxygenase family)